MHEHTDVFATTPASEVETDTDASFDNATQGDFSGQPKGAETGADADDADAAESVAETEPEADEDADASAGSENPV